MDRREVKREIVVPGDPLDGRGLKPGTGTFIEGGRIYAALLGIRDERGGLVSVIPLAGRYIPRVDDVVIGKVIDLGPSFWLVDINSPYPAPLHVNEAPWKVEFGDTQKYLDIGDVLLGKVASVDEQKRVSLTMKDRSSRKLTGGHVIEISPSKVPRVIGKKGSMINMIKESTRCRVFVGQNGRIWIDGDVEAVTLCVRAIHMIEEQAQVLGLTEKVKALLEGARGRRPPALG